MSGQPRTTDAPRLNQIQVVGTHNSYHLEPTAAEKAIRAAADPTGERALEYSHAPLRHQLGAQNVRKLELDLFADPVGGRYADPLLRRLAGEPAYDPRMRRPGSKVLHIPDIDYHTSGHSLVECLTEVKAWSDANPGHMPVTIQLEFRDTPATFGGYRLVEPIRWTHALMLDVDAEIRSVFAADRLITPDDVRRPGRTLRRTILDDGWPELDAVRGRVMFVQSNGGRYRAEYIRDSPNLDGRVQFTVGVRPGHPDTVVILHNDPTGANLAEIRDLVAAGYLVRTRADIPTLHARADDTSRRDAALLSGAHWVDTDFPAPGMADRYGSDYFAALPTGTPARDNPVTAPAARDPARLDPAAEAVDTPLA